MDKTAAVLSDIRAYLRIAAAGSSRATAARVLDTYEKTVVFGRLDGKTPQLKIQETTGISQATISRWVNDFTEAGIAVPPDEIYANHRALFTLRELGVDATALKKRAKGTPPIPPSETSAQVVSPEGP